MADTGGLEIAVSRAVRAPSKLRGEVRVPGDKSISHRALIFNAIADGTARITNLGPGADCTSTIRCLREMSISIEECGDRAVTVAGAGLHGLSEPESVLDAGNSGTTTRLMMGLLAGQDFFSVLTGDASLRTRPMKRVIDPLRLMGAELSGRKGDTLLPVSIRGRSLRGIEYRLPVASAQLKSALLIAGLYAAGATTVHEPAASRDHTERMLKAQGADLRVDDSTITIRSGDRLRALDVDVPGDISSAAFWLVAGACHLDAEITIRDVGMNPGRTGVIEVLREMGASIDVIAGPDRAGEPVADLVVRSSRLRGVRVGGSIVPRLIDEIPILAVAASLADGETVFADASELRVKETDRIAALSAELTRLGSRITEMPDGLVVHGGSRLRGARCGSHGDHRMAMAIAVAGLLAEGETTIEGASVADVSYPSFWADLGRLSGKEVS